MITLIDLYRYRSLYDIVNYRVKYVLRNHCLQKRKWPLDNRKLIKYQEVNIYWQCTVFVEFRGNRPKLWKLCISTKLPYQEIKWNFGILYSLRSIEMYHNNMNYPASIYLLKVNNRNSRIRCEISWKLTIKTPERRQWCR